eukprot:CAMPEP_0113688588 /NCGR_PEP_ID=MMETSP0038_2-20120614/16626_1 /TAXON_ID=2898 /ORGANISM="Cryptomonas paramecium" /LENGTH=229 /DNA_ID=CAMNT_0000609433 /DNA_START=12 /DNA_END=698 /DNA_ORIENTATION=+ /assembly_acc=CAM_ASM_000170
MRETELQSTRYSSVPQTSPDIINFRIKNSQDNSSWEVAGESSWTVQQLKAHLKDKFSLENKRIRLIMLGRLLEDTNTLDFYGIKDGDYVHAAITDEPPPPPPDTAINIPNRRGENEDGDDDDDDSGDERGFDRLAHAGFTRQEIEFLRAQFHSRRGNQVTSEEEMVGMEEAWMAQNQQPGFAEAGSRGHLDRRGMEFAGRLVEANEGTQADMLLGMVMGFVFGVIMLFW